MPTCHPERQYYARSMCRPCYNKEYYAAYYAAHPEKPLAYGRRYREGHRESAAAASRAWSARNPERVAGNHRAYAANNRERMNEIGARRRARKAAVFVEVVRRRIVWERDQGKCGLCGFAADASRWDLEHIIPLSRGGAHAYSNVQVAHPICNQRKHNKLIGERNA